MLSKAQINHIQSLQRKKLRQSEGLYTAEGNKIVQDILDSNAQVSQIFAISPWLTKNRLKLDQLGINYTEVNEKDLKRISTLSTPSQVLAVIKIPKQTKPNHQSDNLILVLDGISDPGNMGTLIRTADWFGVNTILCSEGCVDIYNSKVVQATMGSIARITVTYLNITQHLAEHKDIPAIATVLNGEGLYKTTFPQKAFLIIGSEAHGISEEIITQAKQHVTIPNFGKAESLNAAMAAGIILSHYRLQHP